MDQAPALAQFVVAINVLHWRTALLPAQGVVHSVHTPCVWRHVAESAAEGNNMYSDIDTILGGQSRLNI